MATHALSPTTVTGYRGGLYEWLTTTDHKKIGILYLISSFTFFENEGSKRALMKSGYREIGVEREHIWRDGRWHDTWLAEVMRADWEKEQTG